MKTQTTVQDKLVKISKEPGVYLMKDDGGKVIYIGKARNLKKRLASYFKNSGQLDAKSGILANKISDIKTAGR